MNNYEYLCQACVTEFLIKSNLRVFNLIQIKLPTDGSRVFIILVKVPFLTIIRNIFIFIFLIYLELLKLSLGNALLTLRV